MLSALISSSEDIQVSSRKTATNRLMKRTTVPELVVSFVFYRLK